MEGEMKRFAVAGVCLALGWLAIHLCLDRANAQNEKVTRIRMTVGELRAHGLAVSPNAQPFSNSCQSSGNAGLSVSDELLAHFKAQGFTLETVCLAFSSNMRFDPETGRQLPLAFLPELRDGSDNEIPLNVPLCFRNGVSYLECNYKFHSYWGGKLSPGEVVEERQDAQKVDALVRTFIQQFRPSGVFWRQEYMSSGRYPKWFSVSTEYELFLASRALPRGYGYALHGPEGDDPGEEDVNLSTYRRKSGASSLWSD
jgi:hypothetical protein